MTVLSFIPATIAHISGALRGDSKTISQARDMDRESQSMEEQSKKELEDARKLTISLLNSLGRKKIDICTRGSVVSFIKAASDLRNMPDKELDGLLAQPKSAREVLRDLRKIEASMLKISGEAAAGSGVLTSLGATFDVTVLAAAGAETALATLSDVAAANATLVWLRGGTPAADGAGGAMMLGGIALDPAVLLCGWLRESKGREALETARENRSRVEACQRDIKAICANLDSIGQAASFAEEVLTDLDQVFSKRVEALNRIVSRNNDYESYDALTRNFVKDCFIFNDHLGNIIDIGVMDEDGSLIRGSMNDIWDSMKTLKGIDPL